MSSSVPRPSLAEAVMAYKEQFGDAPTVTGLPPDKHDEAVDALIDAVDAEDPFENDAAFYKEIGLDPPDEDADI